MGDVIYKVDADTGKAVSAFMKILDAQKKVEGGSRRMSRASGRHSKAMAGGVRQVAGQVATLATGFFSVSTAVSVLRGAWQLWLADIQKSVESMEEFKNAFIDLQFLGEHFKDPKLRAKVLAMSAAIGIDKSEVAKGMYTHKSMTGYATDAERAAQWVELVKARRTSSMTLEGMIPTFAKMGAIYRGTTPREMGNIAHVLVEQAGIKNPAELAEYGPRFFMAGKIGKVDVRTAAGIAAFMTQVSGTPGQAAGGMDIALRKVMLADPDEEGANNAFGRRGTKADRKKILAKYGVVEADDAYQRILKLSKPYATGEFDIGERKVVFGEKGLRYGTMMMQDPASLRKMVDIVKTTTGPGVDIVGEKFATVLANDPAMRANLAAAYATAGLGAAMERPENIRWKTVKTRIDQMAQEGRLSGTTRWVADTAMDAARAVGTTPEGYLAKAMSAGGYPSQADPTNWWRAGLSGLAWPILPGAALMMTAPGTKPTAETEALAREWTGIDKPNVAPDKAVEAMARAIYGASEKLENAAAAVEKTVPDVSAHVVE